MVKRLLKAGADKEAKDYVSIEVVSSRITPLVGSCTSSTYCYLSYFYTTAILTRVVQRGQTALFCASLQKKTASLALLIQFGADKEAKNKYGETALGLASRRGRSDVVALLQG